MKFNFIKYALQEAFENNGASGGEPTPTTQEPAPNVQEPIQEPTGQSTTPSNEPSSEPSNDSKSLLDTPLADKAQPNANVPDTADGYEFDAGDGNTVSDIDKANYGEISKELGLTKEQAQKLYKFGTERILKTQMEAIKKAGESWVNEVKNDPEIGGAHFEETKANLARVMNKYGNAEIRQLFNTTQLGSHPAIVKLFNAIGRDLGQDSNFISGGAVQPKKDPLKGLYKNSPNLV